MKKNTCPKRPFNSRPHKEVDGIMAPPASSSSLSIHDLTRRSTETGIDTVVITGSFQFTTSQGGRQKFPVFCSEHGTFQFTTSQGGRPHLIPLLLDHTPFNSRPHKEVDAAGTVPGGCPGILSIHDLTRRSTYEYARQVKKAKLSIHDLTRRSTFPSISQSPFLCPFNSRPHKEVDGICRTIQCNKYLSIHDLTRRSTVPEVASYPPASFNSRPHKEVDDIAELKALIDELFQFTTSQGGRLCLLPPGCSSRSLSIHDLTRRSTLTCWTSISVASFFQFTTSQGGRRLAFSIFFVIRSFNSRPHKEVDQYTVFHRSAPIPFNSRPHKEVDGAEN